MAMPISIPRTAKRSVSGNAWCAASLIAGIWAISATLPPPDPGLQEIDREQQRERADQHQRRDHGGARVVELFELDDDEERDDFRYARPVAGNEDHRAVFSDPARQREREAGHQRRQQRRDDDVHEDMSP